MNNYSNDFDTNAGSPTPPPPLLQNYSLEEYLRLRDNFNEQRNRKVVEIDKESTVGGFAFAVKYVVPVLLLTAFLNPIANDIVGHMGGGFLCLVLGLGFFTIYKVPSFFREMRKQEALRVEEQNKAEYEAFLRKQKNEIKKNKRLR